MASGVDALIGSATPIVAAGRPSIATNITVCPSERSTSAPVRSAAVSTPCCCKSKALPTIDGVTVHVPVTPLPVVETKFETGG